MNRIHRRDFLKLASLLPLGIAAPRMVQWLGGSQNVLVVIFDAWSASNVSMYGYPRETTPNINRLAQRAIRYHNHYAGGDYTTPGTASLLTGVLPWRNRAVQPNTRVEEYYASRNLFSIFPDHHRIAYTHNKWANTLLKQFRHELDELVPLQRLMVGSYDGLVQFLFQNDDDLSSVSWTRTMRVEEGSSYSLLLSRLYEDLLERKSREFLPLYPRGLPTTGSDNGFTIEAATDYLTRQLQNLRRPFTGYFHFLPPHYPYRASREFVDAFLNDGYTPIEKPVDLFARRESRNQPLKRRLYDEYLLYCDREFARLYNILETSGLLENTWLVLTSDHGECFERGLAAHNIEALYQPVIRIPLMIFEPGRTTGMDVYENSSAVDVLPTLAHVTGQPVPEWTEGIVLPPFSPHPAPDRNVHSVRAIHVHRHDPITVGTLIQVRENYKLHYYFGYGETPEDLVKLYDIRSDPEEMNDLAKIKPETAAEMLNELKMKLKEADAPYQKS